MSKGGWRDSIEGPASFVGYHELDENVAKLKELASASQRSRAALIREAVSRYLEEEAA